MADGPATDRYFDVLDFHLKKLEKDDKGDFVTESYLVVLENRASKIYEILFGGEGVLSGQLGGALEHDLAKIRKHWEQNKTDYVTLDSMVQKEVEKLGKEQCLAVKDVAMKGLLWSTRTLNFICTFLEKVLAFPDKGGIACAKETYAETLQPFHGWIGSTTFSGALSWVQDDNLADKFKYDSKEEMAKVLKSCCEQLRPLIEHNFAILDKYDVHFTYKVL
mmetsp:Transcript_12610/g.14464  ORF Transcript_12610/g.14464 Transcript_12610/m.14464 type:complete len:220 (-) Transcript_12610:66-725(-)